MRQHLGFVAALFAMSLTASSASGASLRRGPWLQDVRSDAITVIWQSSQVEASPPQVRYGTTPACQGGAVTAEHRDVNGLSVYAARLTGLTTAQCYHYCLDYDSQARTFCTAHAPGSSDFRFYVVGDNRNNPVVWRTLSEHIVDDALQLPGRNQTFVLHTGDLIGNGGTESDWDQLFPPARRMLAHLPLYVAFGNHEDRNNSTSDAFIYGFFDNPSAASGSGDEKWYGFDYGNVHTTSLAVFDDGGYSSGAQYDWFAAHQASVAARSNVGWRLGLMHFTPWSVGNHGESSAAGLRAALHPIFRDNNVDLVLGGHNHLHARYAPIDGVTYVTAGGGGAGLHSGGYSAWSGGQLESLFQAYGFIIVDVSDTAMTLRALDLIGNTVDHVTFGGTASDRPPFADAGPDQQVTRGATVTLDGSGSVDPEGANLSYQWQQLAGPPVSLQGATSAAPRFVAGASGAVVLSLVVSDVGGQSSTRDIVQVEVTAGRQTLLPVADTYIDDSATGSNFGSANALLVDASPTAYWSYLRFDLSSISAPILAASLRLYCTNPGDDAEVRTSPDLSWSEDTPTWAAPLPVDDSVHAILAAPSADAWTEVDVSSAISPGAARTLVLRPTGSNGADFESREASHPPQLVLTLGDPPSDAGPSDSGGGPSADVREIDAGGSRDTSTVVDGRVADAEQADQSPAPDVAQRDAGGSDGAEVTVEAGSKPDAKAIAADGPGPPETPVSTPCGCRARAVPESWLAVLPLWALRRRKRR